MERDREEVTVKHTYSLPERVVLLDRYFDLRRIERRPDTLAQIATYYRKSSWGYSVFHSTSGSIHMALNPSGEFTREGYRRAPSLVWTELLESRPRRVLELGSGNGFNLEQLSTIAPAASFVGIDLTRPHVLAARSRLRDVANVTIDQGNFEELNYGSAAFDAAFSIESFCHALNVDAAFRSVRDTLTAGSLFVVVDAWRTESANDQDQALLDSLTLTERSMAVSRTMNQADWLDAASSCGFGFVKKIPLSAEVLPNLARFESMAERFMRHPRLARFFGKALKPRILENVIAGYLMAESVRSGYHTYDLIVLRAE